MIVERIKKQGVSLRTIHTLLIIGAVIMAGLMFSPASAA